MTSVGPLIQEVPGAHAPEQLVAQLQGEPGVVVLRSAQFEPVYARYSLVTAQPMLSFRSFGARCELAMADGARVQFGNPWQILAGLMGRLELLDEVDVPFPLGGCFGYWGYELKNFVEPRLPRPPLNDLELPDCALGFYPSLVVFDHALGKTWVVSTGVQPDGSRSPRQARQQLEFWQDRLASRLPTGSGDVDVSQAPDSRPDTGIGLAFSPVPAVDGGWSSTMSRAEYVHAVEQAQRYIRAGDIYQVNLSHRLSASWPGEGWEFFRRLAQVSPAPFAAYVDCGDFQIASSSPELFLRCSGPHLQTRPIKGTRPRAADPDRDARLAYELQTSGKEMAELVMITDLLRNDLGKVCEFGSVRVPELIRLERYPHVQHLVSTVEGRLPSPLTHLDALIACFPGGSISGAPKIRAMEIISELEPLARGPYTGCLGYLGFNRESQLSIVIRTAVCQNHQLSFHVGAGIVADSDPQAEYEETLAKAGGFVAALKPPQAGASRAPALPPPSPAHCRIRCQDRPP